MAQTPVSASVEVLTGTTTLYTVPAGKTAVVKGVMGGSVVGNASATYTVNKVSSGSTYPITTLQVTSLTPATGGTVTTGNNLLKAPVTLAAGEAITVYTGASNAFQIPNISTYTNQYGTSITIYQIVYANSIFMAVGINQANNGFVCLTSSDGVTWTAQNPSPVLIGVQTVAYGNGYWVAVPVYGYDQGKIYYSSNNGVTWTSLTINASYYVVSVIYANSTWVLNLNGLSELYTATTPTSWTLNTAWGTFVYGGTSSQAMQISWNGTYWIFTISRSGIAYSSDLSTFYTLGTVGPGYNALGYVTSVISYSSTYGKWYAMIRANNVADTIWSSTDGQKWTKGTNPAYNSSWGVITAGSNPVLLVNNSNQNNGGSSGVTANHLVSTDGVTWAYASDSRGYSGGLFGFENGYFVKFSSTSQATYYISTDPTTSTGTNYNNSATFNAISSCGASAPAGSGGKWAIWGVNATDIMLVGGTSSTNAGVLVSSGFSVSVYGNPRSAIYNPTDGYFYMITQTGHMFYCSSHNGGVSYLNQVISGGDGDYQLGYFNGFVYASCDVTSGSAVEYSYIAPSTNPSSFTSYSPASGTYPRYGLTSAASQNFRPSRFAASSTRLLSLNQYNSASIYDSTQPFTLKYFPLGIGSTQRLNNTDVMYGGLNGLNNQNYGVYQSSDITTTIPTLSQTAQTFGGVSYPYWNKRNYMAYINSKYYMTSSSAIFSGTTIPTATSTATSSTSVNGESWLTIDVNTEIIGSGSGAYLLPTQGVSSTALMPFGYTSDISNAVNNSYMTGSIVQID